MTLHYFDPVERASMERALSALESVADGEYPELVYRDVEPTYRKSAEEGHARAVARDAAGVLRALLQPRIQKQPCDCGCGEIYGCEMGPRVRVRR